MQAGGDGPAGLVLRRGGKARLRFPATMESHKAPDLSRLRNEWKRWAGDPFRRPRLTDTSPLPARPRYQTLDLARGVAIIAMVVFHVAWDLYYYGFSSVDVTTAPGWVVFQKAILTSFLALVGAGLWLGHGERIRWRSFWRRWVLIAGAAVLVTAGTVWMLPDYFVFFGVLHAIALFSLAALPLLALPTWAQAGLGTTIVAVSFAFTDPIFTERWLAWIGFWPISPPTSDVVPIFPWFGVVLLGIAAIRISRARPEGRRLLEARSDEPIVVGLAWMGRWSLVIYLVHQPLIIGALWVLMQMQGQPVMPAPAPVVTTEATAFTESCRASCLAAAGSPEQCAAYCGCALEEVIEGDLWAALAAVERTAEQQLAVDGVTRICREMSR